MSEIEVLRLNVAEREADRIMDVVAQEKPLQIFLNRTFYATIFCSPSCLKDLAVGHLLTEGIIDSVEDVEEVSLKGENCQIKIKLGVDFKKRLRTSRLSMRVILSGCGGEKLHKPVVRLPRIKSGFSVTAETVLKSTNQLNFPAETYRKTGGVHAAAIWKGDGTLVALAEDVGRHNAVDKVVGMATGDNVDLGQSFLTLTGRLTGDIVLKSAMVNLPLVASMAAAIDSGVDLARQVGLTLVGFARGKRMNIYTCEDRILW
jgi:FdhD protein